MSEAELWAEIKRLKSQVAELATREKIGASSVGALVAPRVVYVGTGGTLTTEAGFEYDATGNELQAGRLRSAEQSAPSTPASGFAVAYPDANGLWRSIDDAGNSYLLSKRNIMSRVYRTTAQTLTTGTPAAISFDAERYDLGNFWVVGSPTRLTVPIAGRCLVSACAAFASNATGVRNIDIRLNGATVIGSQLQVAASGIITIVSVATVYEFAATDYVEMVCFQNSGGNLNVNSTGNYTPEFAIDYLGPMT